MASFGGERINFMSQSDSTSHATSNISLVSRTTSAFDEPNGVFLTSEDDEKSGRNVFEGDDFFEERKRSSFNSLNQNDQDLDVDFAFIPRSEFLRSEQYKRKQHEQFKSDISLLSCPSVGSHERNIQKEIFNKNQDLNVENLNNSERTNARQQPRQNEPDEKEDNMINKTRKTENIVNETHNQEQNVAVIRNLPSKIDFMKRFRSSSPNTKTCTDSSSHYSGGEACPDCAEGTHVSGGSALSGGSSRTPLSRLLMFEHRISLMAPSKTSTTSSTRSGSVIRPRLRRRLTWEGSLNKSIYNNKTNDCSRSLPSSPSRTKSEYFYSGKYQKIRSFSENAHKRFSGRAQSIQNFRKKISSPLQRLHTYSKNEQPRSKERMNVDLNKNNGGNNDDTNNNYSQQKSPKEEAEAKPVSSADDTAHINVQAMDAMNITGESFKGIKMFAENKEPSSHFFGWGDDYSSSQADSEVTRSVKNQDLDIDSEVMKVDSNKNMLVQDDSPQEHLEQKRAGYGIVEKKPLEEESDRVKGYIDVTENYQELVKDVHVKDVTVKNRNPFDEDESHHSMEENVETKTIEKDFMEGAHPTKTSTAEMDGKKSHNTEGLILDKNNNQENTSSKKVQKYIIGGDFSVSHEKSFDNKSESNESTQEYVASNQKSIDHLNQPKNISEEDNYLDFHTSKEKPPDTRSDEVVVASVLVGTQIGNDIADEKQIEDLDDPEIKISRTTLLDSLEVSRDLKEDEKVMEEKKKVSEEVLEEKKEVSEEVLEEEKEVFNEAVSHVKKKAAEDGFFSWEDANDDDISEYVGDEGHFRRSSSRFTSMDDDDDDDDGDVLVDWSASNTSYTKARRESTVRYVIEDEVDMKKPWRRKETVPAKGGEAGINADEKRPNKNSTQSKEDDSSSEQTDNPHNHHHNNIIIEDSDHVENRIVDENSMAIMKDFSFMSISSRSSQEEKNKKLATIDYSSDSDSIDSATKALNMFEEFNRPHHERPSQMEILIEVDDEEDDASLIQNSNRNNNNGSNSGSAEGGNFNSTTSNLAKLNRQASDLSDEEERPSSKKIMGIFSKLRAGIRAGMLLNSNIVPKPVATTEDEENGKSKREDNDKDDDDDEEKGSQKQFHGHRVGEIVSALAQKFGNDNDDGPVTKRRESNFGLDFVSSFDSDERDAMLNGQEESNASSFIDDDGSNRDSNSNISARRLHMQRSERLSSRRELSTHMKGISRRNMNSVSSRNLSSRQQRQPQSIDVDDECSFLDRSVKQRTKGILTPNEEHAIFSPTSLASSKRRPVEKLLGPFAWHHKIKLCISLIVSIAMIVLLSYTLYYLRRRRVMIEDTSISNTPASSPTTNTTTPTNMPSATTTMPTTIKVDPEILSVPSSIHSSNSNNTKNATTLVINIRSQKTNTTNSSNFSNFTANSTSASNFNISSRTNFSRNSNQSQTEGNGTVSFDFTKNNDSLDEPDVNNSDADQNADVSWRQYSYGISIEKQGLESSSPWIQKGSNLHGLSIGDRFGTSVSISDNGNIVAVGSRFDRSSLVSENSSTSGIDSGYVHVYRFVIDEGRETWLKAVTLRSNKNNHSHGQFGSQISLSGDGHVLAVSAPFVESSYGHQSGLVKAYYLKFDGDDDDDELKKRKKRTSNYHHQLGQDIYGENAGDFEGFSMTLSKSGRRLATGAIGYDLPVAVDGYDGTNRGRVRVFRYDESTNMWMQLGNDIVGFLPYQMMGRSIDLSKHGDVVAVGSWKTSHADVDHNDYGSVSVFRLDDDNSSTKSTVAQRSQRWVPLGKPVKGSTEHDHTGMSVSLSDDGKILATTGGWWVGDDDPAVYTASQKPHMEKNGEGSSQAVVGRCTCRIFVLDDANADKEVVWKSQENIIFGGSFDLDVVSDPEPEAWADFSSSVRLSSDGNRLVTSSKTYWGNRGIVNVYDLSYPSSLSLPKLTSKRHAGDRAYNVFIGSKENVYFGDSLSLSSDGRFLVVGSPGNEQMPGEVRIYQLMGGQF